MAAAGAWYTGCRDACERCTGGRERGGRLRRGRGARVAVVRCALLVVRVLHGLIERACMMGARVVVVEVAGRGGLRWRRGTRVAVVRCSLLAETAVERSTNR